MEYLCGRLSLVELRILVCNSGHKGGERGEASRECVDVITVGISPGVAGVLSVPT